MARRPLRSLGSLHGRVVHSRRVRVLARHLAELIPGGHSVLDVGCGDGLIDRLILDRRPDLRICGADPLIRPESHIPVVPFDGRRLPFTDRSWDTVLFCDVLHHTERPLELIMEAVRVARHSILIKDHSVEGCLARPALRFMDFVGNAPHGIALAFNYFTPAQWEDAYRATGLVPLEVRRKLGLYPSWAEPFFGRSLHFVAIYNIHRDEGE
jgi:SAM-dependent methyltransferase